MVVFTCNKCGESLQKPKVEKHYATICRGTKSLTCVDCFKDFKKEEYVAHTKCVTEEERYAAKGSIPGGGIVKKGEIKQESWTELIQSVINKVNNPTLNGQILGIIANSTNVPRKKNKFINFIKSAAGFKINLPDIEAVWNIIEKEKMNQKAVAANANEETADTSKNEINTEEPKPKKKKSKTAEDDEQKSDELVVGITDSKKKKKKSKSIEDNGELITNEHQPEISNNFEKIKDGEISQKKKKKSKTTQESINNETINEELPSENADNQKSLEKKKRKSKSVQENGIKDDSDQINKVDLQIKKKSKENEVCKVSNLVPNGKSDALENSITENVQKKKKRKSQPENNENNNSVTVEEFSEKPKKKAKVEVAGEKIENSVEPSVESAKKKKRKSKGTDLEQALVGSPESKKVKKVENDLQVNSKIPEFSYAKKILEIMQSKLEMSVETLQKKVLHAYTKHTGNEPTPKIIKHFNKKLRKTKGVEVLEGIVKFK